jgi:hypothetical protein
MDLGSLLFIFSLLILVGLFVSRPFFERGRANQLATAVSPAGEKEHETSALLAERDRILNALQELDFDYAVGKIPEEDYPEQRSSLLVRGAEVLRRLDALVEEPSPAAAGPELQGDHQARLEAAIAERRGRPATETGAGAGAAEAGISSNGHRSAAGIADDPLEAMIASRRRARQEKAAGFCPQCGGPVQKSDMFCPKCGAGLKK